MLNLYENENSAFEFSENDQKSSSNESDDNDEDPSNIFILKDRKRSIKKHLLVQKTINEEKEKLQGQYEKCLKNEEEYLKLLKEIEEHTKQKEKDSKSSKDENTQEYKSKCKEYSDKLTKNSNDKDEIYKKLEEIKENKKTFLTKKEELDDNEKRFNALNEQNMQNILNSTKEYLNNMFARDELDKRKQYSALLKLNENLIKVTIVYCDDEESAKFYWQYKPE